MKHSRSLFILFMVLFSSIVIVLAQSEWVAQLTTTTSGVELQRVGTDGWVEVDVESIIGVGDMIRTTGEGSGTVRFFGEDSYIVLAPNSVIRIDRLLEAADGFSISYRIIQGSVEQVLRSPETKPATYEISTSTLSLLTRGGQLLISAAENGETNALTLAGEVYITSGAELIALPPDSGLRANSDSTLSAVLPATRFEELSAALDGVPAFSTFEGDVTFNVRSAPRRDGTLIGSLAPSEVQRVAGVSEDGEWFRIPFNGAFGWVSGENTGINTVRTYLPTFPATYVEPSPSAAGGPVVSVPAATPVPTETAPTGTSADILNAYRLSEVEVVARLNEWRISQGLSPFALNDTLSKMAVDQARYLLTLSRWPDDPHIDGRGRNPRQRAIDPTYSWPTYGHPDRVAVAEIAYTGFSPEAAVNWWRGSSLHTQIVTNTGYREIGVGTLPHPLGTLYIVVVGSRPNIFPVLLDPVGSEVFVSQENYRYATFAGAPWLQSISSIQFIPSILTQLDDNAWSPYTQVMPLTQRSDFAVAFRGSNSQIVLSDVRVSANIAWLMDNLPQPGAVAASAESAPLTFQLPPPSNFQPVVAGTPGAAASGLYPTNTPPGR